MARLSLIVLASALMGAQAFARTFSFVTSKIRSGHGPNCQSFFDHLPLTCVSPSLFDSAQRHYSQTALRMTDTETEAPAKKFVERGVSVDQDGKSNVWAIEPREQLSTKSAEEQTQSLLIAGGGLAAAAVAAGLILTNLPDPNQF